MKGWGLGVAFALATATCSDAKRKDGAEDPTSPTRPVSPSEATRATETARAPSPGAGVEARGAWASAPAEGLVDLRAAVFGLCFDVRYASDRNFTGAPLPGYEVPGAWLREEAAAALGRAQAELRRRGFALLVYDAYRPRRATRAMAAWARAQGREDLLDRGFIAEDSAHARGRTVDVGLCDPESGEPLDLGTDFDAFVPAARHGAATGEPGKRRATLKAAMERAGFSPYAREWWHYSLVASTPAAALDAPYTAPP